MLSKLRNNIITLCQFCHRRVHAKRVSTFVRQSRRQEQLLLDLQSIAPKQFCDMEVDVNVALINELRKMMCEKTHAYEYQSSSNEEDVLAPEMTITWYDEEEFIDPGLLTQFTRFLRKTGRLPG